MLSGQQMSFYHRSEANEQAKPSSADQGGILFHIPVLVNSGHAKHNSFSPVLIKLIMHFKKWNTAIWLPLSNG